MFKKKKYVRGKKVEKKTAKKKMNLRSDRRRYRHYFFRESSSTATITLCPDAIPGRETDGSDWKSGART